MAANTSVDCYSAWADHTGGQTTGDVLRYIMRYHWAQGGWWAQEL